MEQLVDQVLALRAERLAPHLSAEESALLSRINQGLSASERVRMRTLLEKRDEQMLTPAEWQELTTLTDKLELLHADRLAALADLAQVRGVTLDAVIQQHDIHVPDLSAVGKHPAQLE